MEDGLKVTKIFLNQNFANATIGGRSAICDNAVIHGKSEIGGDVFIADSAEICGGAKIDKCENIGGDAYIYSSEDVLFISYNFSKRGLTFFKAREDEICVSNGYTYRLEDYLNMLNNQSFNKERDILLLAKNIE